MKVDQRGVGRLGEIEEYFVSGLVPGDSFMFAGRILRYQGMRKPGVIDVVPLPQQNLKCQLMRVGDCR